MSLSAKNNDVDLINTYATIYKKILLFYKKEKTKTEIEH